MHLKDNYILFIHKMNVGLVNMAPFNEAFDMNFEEVNSIEYKIKKINKRLKLLEKTTTNILETLNKICPDSTIKLESYKTLELNDHISNHVKINKYDENPEIKALKEEIRDLTKKDAENLSGRKLGSLMKARIELRDAIIGAAMRNNYLFYSKALKSAVANYSGNEHFRHRERVFKNEYCNIK